jgi:beta-lactamase class A
MGRDDREAVRVGKSDAAQHLAEPALPHPADAAASPIPPHEGEGWATRRAILASAAASFVAAPAFAAADRFAALEARVLGRIGVYARDLVSGRTLTHRAHERFPMCSTFKAMAAATALKMVDAGQLRLDAIVRYGPSDLMDYAPTTKAHVADGGMKLADLLAAAVELSDNTAANLILGQIGGPAGWTRFVRSIGDASSRLDRTEPALNTSKPGDPRDTTTPAAMGADLKATLLGAALAPTSRDLLTGWMVACQTGAARLRAGLPAAWRIADKTGTWNGSGDWASSNDIAVAWTPSGPIVIACYVQGRDAVHGDVRDQAIASVGKLVAETFRPHG